MHSPVLQFAFAFVGYWFEFVIGALTIGAGVGFAIALVERLRKQSVSWGTYVAILVVGGTLTAAYYAWFDQYQLVIQHESSLSDRDATIKRMQNALSNISLGIDKTAFIFRHEQRTVQATFQIKNYSPAIQIENIACATMIVFGSGKDSFSKAAIKPPTWRLGPGQSIVIEIDLTPRSFNKPIPYVSLIKRKQPIVVTLLIYFTVGTYHFSQREVFSYDFNIGKWKIEAEQQVRGFVSWPIWIINGVAYYGHASWLPPPPVGGCLASEISIQ